MTISSCNFLCVIDIARRVTRVSACLTVSVSVSVRLYVCVVGAVEPLFRRHRALCGESSTSCERTERTRQETTVDRRQWPCWYAVTCTLTQPVCCYNHRRI